MNTSYGQLVLTATNVYNSVQRDWTDFDAMGILQKKLDAFKAKIDEGGTDFDQIYLIPQVELTAQKNSIEKELRPMLNRANIVLSNVVNKTNLEKGTNVQAAGNYPSERLVIIARAAVWMLRQHESRLDEFGVAPTFIDRMEQLANQLFTVLADREVATRERDLATQLRQRNYDDLYTDLSFFSQMGKSFYKATDAARYNDYVLSFGSNSGKTQASTEGEQTEPDVPDTTFNGVDDPPTNTLGEPKFTKF